MRNLILWSGIFVIASMGVLTIVKSADAAEPKYTIKQVMGEAHKNKLRDKVTSGNASDDEKAKLVELYVALSQNKPKKGSEESWKEKTDAIVAAVKASDWGALNKATNCGGCHRVHK